jgi:hypothetical protein
MAGQQPPAASRSRSRTRLIVQMVVSLVLVVAIFYYLFKGIDLAQVWADIRAMTWLEDLTLLAAAVWNMATYSLVWMTVAPGLGFWRATMMSQSTAAVSSTVPWAGPVIGTGMTYSMFAQWGYSGAQTTTAVLVSGVWNSFAKLALPVLALALLALQGGAAGGRVVAGLVGIAGLVGAIVVFALILRSEDLARRFGRWAGRLASRLLGVLRRPPVAGWEVATVRFRARTLALLGGRWVPITVATLVSHLSTYLVLLLALRHVGGQRRRGLLGTGAGLVCLCAAADRGADHPCRVGIGGGDSDRRADRRRGGSGAGDGRGAGVPGADLVPADPGRGRLLAVVAQEPAGVPAGHPSGWPTGGHPRGRRSDQHRPAGHPGTQPPVAALTTWPTARAMPCDALLAQALPVTLHRHLGFCVADAAAAAVLNQRLPPSHAANQ